MKMTTTTMMERRKEGEEEGRLTRGRVEGEVGLGLVSASDGFCWPPVKVVAESVSF